MEDRHHLKSPRTGHTALEDAPVERHSHHHKKVLLSVGVVMSMVVILGLYVASFRFRELVPRNAAESSRWSVLQDEFLDDSRSIVDGFREITGTVTGALNANKVRAESINIMKTKLAESASGTEETESATSTPDTEDMTENAPTEN